MINDFQNLFSTSDTQWEEVIGCIKARVTEEQNALLEDPIDPKEVKAALFQMNPDKSLGPDGFNLGFYQKFWDIVGLWCSIFLLHVNFRNTLTIPILF